MQPITRSQHAPDRIGIYRIPHAIAGYVLHVVLRRNGIVFTKRFWEHRCGDHVQALQMAQAWRDRVIAQHPAMTLAQFCSIVRSNNTSGIPGVARREKGYRTKEGIDVRNAYWVACVPRSGGTVSVRHFSIAKLGEDDARRLAIEAREQGLAELESVVFRQQMQPMQVSSRAHMDALEALLNEPAERRALRDQQRAQRDQARTVRRQRAAEAQRVAIAQRDADLLAASNRSGEPYIGRYITKSMTGNWRVSIERGGVKYRKTFSDSVYGTADDALSAAKAWRDRVFLDNPTLPTGEVAARINTVNTSGVAGVFLSRPSGKTKYSSWVARSPKNKGVSTRSKRYSIEKYGNNGAFALAVEARAAFLLELGDEPFLSHRAARQLQKILSSTDGREPSYFEAINDR
ncbi:hypothetical protein CR152_06585 [Massilia violaceinigra]|uniref:AP2/ERF domain-containing protein n=1 Tax=Massilia violaceinigra TaxID=2045208 RepID=A0A2D2DGT5_9BURK|nr:AP2 domain-containing protein [Massilia violaceinigra]ATQ74202.1 hypothetical protein CR152_06585 [Massilia violaceinigra]